MKKSLANVLRVTPMLSTIICFASLSTTAVARMATPKVIYGADDRLEVQEVSDIWQDVARSTAAMVVKSDAVSGQNGDITLEGKSLQKTGVCADERFAAQPTLGMCSAFLVAPDILVTAGHCVADTKDCQNYLWVFDYNDQALMTSKAGMVSVNFSSENVYSCSEVITSRVAGGSGVDYAVVRLDREVVGRTPLKIRESGKIEKDQSVVVIGHPTGLPTKVAGGARVRDNKEMAYFSANLDTFGGNSGSAVFNADTLEVEGILVRGEEDYRMDYSSKCRRVYTCKDHECRGEDVTRIEHVLPFLK
jgi:V8-like Glu-specific endopeptidase